MFGRKNGCRYFIDSENVNEVWVNILNILKPEDHIFLFYTDNSAHISCARAVELINIGAKQITGIRCKEGNNGLDFQMVTQLGAVISKSPKCEYILISNDNGFDAVVSYWKQKGYNIRREKSSFCVSLQISDPTKASTEQKKASGTGGRQNSNRRYSNRPRLENKKDYKKQQPKLEDKTQQPAAGKTYSNKPYENKTYDNKTYENKSGESKTGENKKYESRTAENKKAADPDTRKAKKTEEKKPVKTHGEETERPRKKNTAVNEAAPELLKAENGAAQTESGPENKAAQTGFRVENKAVPAGMEPENKAAQGKSPVKPEAEPVPEISPVELEAEPAPEEALAGPETVAETEPAREISSVEPESEPAQENSLAEPETVAEAEPAPEEAPAEPEAAAEAEPMPEEVSLDHDDTFEPMEKPMAIPDTATVADGTRVIDTRYCLQSLCTMISRKNMALFHNALTCIFEQKDGDEIYASVKSHPELHTQLWSRYEQDREARIHGYLRLLLDVNDCEVQDTDLLYQVYRETYDGSLQGLNIGIMKAFGDELGVKYYRLLRKHINILTKL